MNNYISNIIYNLINDKQTKINFLYVNRDLLKYKIKIYFDNWFSILFDYYGHKYPNIDREDIKLHSTIIDFYINIITKTISNIGSDLELEPNWFHYPVKIMKQAEYKYPEFGKYFYSENIAYIQIGYHGYKSVNVNCNSQSKYYGLFIEDLYSSIGYNESMNKTRIDQTISKFDFRTPQQKLLDEKIKEYSIKYKIPTYSYYYNGEIVHLIDEISNKNMIFIE
jgi:hypothetical protein